MPAEHVVTATPPLAPRRPTVLRAHGDERVDDWFWLRDRDDPKVREYLEAENAYTREVMARTEPLQVRLFEEIKSRIQETDASAPVRKGPYEYFSRTIEGRQYGIQCRRPAGTPGLPDPFAPPGTAPGEEVLLDQNELAAGHDHLHPGGFPLTRRPPRPRPRRVPRPAVGDRRPPVLLGAARRRHASVAGLAPPARNARRRR